MWIECLFIVRRDLIVGIIIKSIFNKDCLELQNISSLSHISYIFFPYEVSEDMDTIIPSEESSCKAYTACFYSLLLLRK
jgi:hypothetical protein